MKAASAGEKNGTLLRQMILREERRESIVEETFWQSALKNRKRGKKRGRSREIERERERVKSFMYEKSSHKSYGNLRCEHRTSGKIFINSRKGRRERERERVKAVCLI